MGEKHGEESKRRRVDIRKILLPSSRLSERLALLTKNSPFHYFFLPFSFLDPLTPPPYCQELNSDCEGEPSLDQLRPPILGVILAVSISIHPPERSRELRYYPVANILHSSRSVLRRIFSVPPQNAALCEITSVFCFCLYFFFTQ